MARLDNGAVNSFCGQTDIRISVLLDVVFVVKEPMVLYCSFALTAVISGATVLPDASNFGIKVLCSQSLCDIIDQLFLINGKAILLSRENELPCFCIKAVDGTTFLPSYPTSPRRLLPPL